jgi:hypothetical protein
MRVGKCICEGIDNCKGKYEFIFSLVLDKYIGNMMEDEMVGNIDDQIRMRLEKSSY